MISKAQITNLIAEKVETDGYFLVDVDVKPSNRIVVLLDGEKGVPIEYCVSISRLIEHSLDRESADFELEVSSPGIGQPFKVLQQYKKCIGRTVEVVTPTGVKIAGELISAAAEGFVVRESKMVKPEGKKKKELQVIDHPFNFGDVKSVKEIIKF
jgi:ribosome maturation factor RimP